MGTWTCLLTENGAWMTNALSLRIGSRTYVGNRRLFEVFQIQLHDTKS